MIPLLTVDLTGYWSRILTKSFGDFHLSPLKEAALYGYYLHEKHCQDIAKMALGEPTGFTRGAAVLWGEVKGY